MSDIVDKKTRSRMMSGIKNKNTKPEILIRKNLFKAGFRYRIHVNNLYGKPDIFLKKYNAVIFINGCFWHKHDCHLFKWPKTRPDFWKKKILRNYSNDLYNRDKLLNEGYRVLVIWECAIKGKKKYKINSLMQNVINWINSDNKFLEIVGQ